MNGDLKNKAGKILRILGSENLPNTVISHLDEEEKKRLLYGFEKVKETNIQEENSLLTLFNSFFKNSNENVEIGSELENKIKDLLKILKEEKNGTEKDKTDFKNLKSKKYFELKKILIGEEFDIIALVLFFSEPSESAKVLEDYPENIREKIILEFEKIDSQDRRCIEKLENFLKFKEKIRNENLSIDAIQNYKGKEVAEILNHLSPTQNSNLISKINQKNPNLMKDISSYFYKIEDILQLNKRDLNFIFTKIPVKIATIVLKSIEKQQQEKIFLNLKPNLKQKMKLELECIGPISISQIETAQKGILNTLKFYVENGFINSYKV